MATNPQSGSSDKKYRDAWGELDVRNIMHEEPAALKAKIALLEAELAPATTGKDLEPYRVLTNSDAPSKSRVAQIDSLVTKLSLETTAARDARRQLEQSRENDLQRQVDEAERSAQELLREKQAAEGAANSSQQELERSQWQSERLRKDLAIANERIDRLIVESGQAVSLSRQNGELQGELNQRILREGELSASNAALTSQLDEARTRCAELEANAERMDSLGKVILEQRRALGELLAKTNARSRAELTQRYGHGHV